jgi:hypothetical protein
VLAAKAVIDREIDIIEGSITLLDLSHDFVSDWIDCRI